MFNIPKVLDFNLNDPIIIDYAMSSSENLKGIKLNTDAGELECEDIYDMHKRCKVTKSHFMNKNSGYYHTYYENHGGNSTMFYESSPIKVILPNNIYISIKKEDNENIVTIGEDNFLALVTE